jgi:hypothetical protein
MEAQSVFMPTMFRHRQVQIGMFRKRRVYALANWRTSEVDSGIIRSKRVYERAALEDGLRIPVERLFLKNGLFRYFDLH